MNRLAILEDNMDFSRNLLNHIMNGSRKIQLWNLSVDGEEIEEKLKELDGGDIVLLDLGLPTINGIEIIKELRSRENNVPYIIVMSGNSRLMEELKKYQDCVYAVIQKPFSFKRIISIIDEISYGAEQNILEKMVKTELEKFEFNTITIGYRYMLEAIVYSMEDPSVLKDMKNLLYPLLARNHNVDVANIKWTIEKCIRSVRRYTDSKVLNEYFRIAKKEKLTPKLLVTTIVHNLKEEYEKLLEEENEVALT